MRASTLVLGPLVARWAARASRCPVAAPSARRPIDLHIKGLEQLGAKITQEHGYIEATRRAPARRRNRLRQDHRHRHGRPADGRHAGRRRNRPAKLRPRAGGRRSRRPAEQDGSAHRRRGHAHHSRAGRRQTTRRAAPHHPRPHRGRHLSSSRARLPAAI